MQISHFARSFFALGWVVISASVLAQAPAPKPQYQPTVGQEGKDVVWVPTPQTVVDKMLDLAKVTPADFIIDLGSGDGRTVITAIKRGARALGIEYNPDMVELSKRNAANEGLGDKAVFTKADLFETDFSRATVITMFLLADINLRLRPKILDLKPGTRIVSNTFTMDDWTADETATVADCENWCTALLWIVPAKVEGPWRMEGGDLTFKQQFQMISGTLKSDGGTPTAITNGKLRGNQISFNVGTAQYTGRVNGNTIDGTVKSAKSQTSWKATRGGA